MSFKFFNLDSIFLIYFSDNSIILSFKPLSILYTCKSLIISKLYIFSSKLLKSNEFISSNILFLICVTFKLISLNSSVTSGLEICKQLADEENSKVKTLISII